MISQMYAVYDEKTQFHLPPFTAHNNSDALRQIKRLLFQGESIFQQFPEDYKLYHIASYNDATGVIESKKPVPVCRLIDLMPKEHNNEDDSRNMDNDS